MRLRTIIACFMLMAASALPAAAQRGGGPNWEFLGEATVGYGADRDVISVGRPEDHFRDRAYRRLRIVAENGDFRMRMLKLRYLNGFEEEITVDQNVRSGQDIVVDLRGERSFLSQIEMFYGSRFGIDIGSGGIRLNKPKVKVYGENRGIGLPSTPRPPVPTGWEEIGSANVPRGADTVVVNVGRREGRFGQIRFRVDGAPLSIRSAQIRFGNGETQTVRVGDTVGEREWSRAIDVDGDRRFIERITFNLVDRGRRGPSEIFVLGNPRPAAPPADDRRRGWVPLGEQTVGFRVDRDVIRVGQDEEFFRNRAFRRLHFVAERNDINMRSIRITYLNGYSETFDVNREIKAGGDLAVDLRGERSYIREIEMIYRARPSFSGQAVMRVFGEPAR